MSLLTITLFSVGYSKCNTRYLTSDTEIYETYIEQWETPYTAESVLDINVMKAEKRNGEEVRDYYRSLLEQNGIAY